MTPRDFMLSLVEQIQQAQVIVLGTFESESPAGSIVGPQGDPLRLYRVKITVENILKGTALRGRLEFFFYLFEGAWNGSPPNYFYRSGERAIFYLVHDGAVLRAVNDVYLSHTSVSTGRHPGWPRPEVSLMQTIAAVLLIPGEGVDMKSYLASLDRATAKAVDVVGKAETARLLKDLLKNANGKVRGRSCITLAEFPLNDKECLPTLLQDAEALPEDRESAKRLLHKN